MQRHGARRPQLGPQQPEDLLERGGAVGRDRHRHVVPLQPGRLVRGQVVARGHRADHGPDAPLAPARRSRPRGARAGGCVPLPRAAPWPPACAAGPTRSCVARSSVPPRSLPHPVRPRRRRISPPRRPKLAAHPTAAGPLQPDGRRRARRAPPARGRDRAAPARRRLRDRADAGRRPRPRPGGGGGPRRARRVVAVGGDGLLRPLAAALRDTDGALAVIPAGRGNDFARVLGDPDGPAGPPRSPSRARSGMIDVADGGRRGLPGHREPGLRLRRQPDRERVARDPRQHGLPVRRAAGAGVLEAAPRSPSRWTGSATSCAATRWPWPTRRPTAAACTSRPRPSWTTASWTWSPPARSRKLRFLARHAEGVQGQAPRASRVCHVIRGARDRR